jgi:hypothetical protein
VRVTTGISNPKRFEIAEPTLSGSRLASAALAVKTTLPLWM